MRCGSSTRFMFKQFPFRPSHTTYGHLFPQYRHLDPMILCCLYGVAKTMRIKPELTFTRIFDAYVSIRHELGDVTCQRIMRHILLSTDTEPSNNGDDTPPIGDVIVFYNRVFIPLMKHYLLRNPSLKLATEELHIGA